MYHFKSLRRAGPFPTKAYNEHSHKLLLYSASETSSKEEFIPRVLREGPFILPWPFVQWNSQQSQLTCFSIWACFSGVLTSHTFNSDKCNQNTKLIIWKNKCRLEIYLKVGFCSAFTADMLGGFKEVSLLPLPFL